MIGNRRSNSGLQPQALADGVLAAGLELGDHCLDLPAPSLAFLHDLAGLRS
jgi:hypothetical protein